MGLQVRGCLLENLIVSDREEETMPSWQEEHLETFVLLISLLEELHQRLSTYHQAMFWTYLMLPKSMPRLELISSSWRAKITDVDQQRLGSQRTLPPGHQGRHCRELRENTSQQSCWNGHRPSSVSSRRH